MTIHGVSPLGRIDSLDVAAAHGATMSSSSNAKQQRVKQRVNAYRHALQRLESSSSTSGFKIGSNVESAKAMMFTPTITKGTTMEISTSISSSRKQEEDSEADDEEEEEDLKMPDFAMPKVATRKSLTLVSKGHPMARNNNNWVRLSGSLDREELERMRFSKHQRKPLAESRDSLLLDGLLIKAKSERAEQLVKESAATKAKAEEEQDQEVVMPKLSTRRSFSLITRQDSSRLSLGTGAVVTKTKVTDAVVAAEPETYDDDPVFVGDYDHEMAEDERSNSYEWEDPMLDQGFDLGLLGLTAPAVVPIKAPVAGTPTDAKTLEDTFTADVLKGLQCEWDEWWTWYAEAMQYSEAVEALDSIDVPMSVCYVTHVNSYLLEDLDDTNTRTAWEANARLMGLDDDDCNEAQADAVFSDVDDVDEMAVPHTGVRDSMAAAGRRLSHRISSLKHSKTDSGVSAMSSASSTSEGGTRRVRFARRHLSIGFAYSMPDDFADDESVDSTDNISRFYEDGGEETNPTFLTMIESDSEDDSEGEYETDSDADSDSESRVDMDDLNNAENSDDDDGFSDDDDAGGWSDVESDSDTEEGDAEQEPVPDVGRSRSMVDRGAIMAMFGAGQDGGGKESFSQSSSQSSLNSDPTTNTISMPFESDMGMVGAMDKDIGMQVKGRTSQVVTKKDFNMSGMGGKGKGGGGKRRGSSIASAFVRTFGRRRSSTRKPSRTTAVTA